MGTPARMNDISAPVSVTWPDVEAASARLEGVAHRTPVATSSLFDARAGCQAYFKCENLQRMGALKFRGASNALSQLDAKARQRGVVAFSSDLRAQYVALPERLLGVHITHDVRADAPSVMVVAA